MENKVVRNLAFWETNTRQEKMTEKGPTQTRKRDFYTYLSWNKCYPNLRKKIVQRKPHNVVEKRILL
jgi:hypothetical protein